jgi:hypothetical protein
MKCCASSITASQVREGTSKDGWWLTVLCFPGTAPHTLEIHHSRNGNLLAGWKETFILSFLHFGFLVAAEMRHKATCDAPRRHPGHLLSDDAGHERAERVDLRESVVGAVIGGIGWDGVAEWLAWDTRHERAEARVHGDEVLRCV